MSVLPGPKGRVYQIHLRQRAMFNITLVCCSLRLPYFCAVLPRWSSSRMRLYMRSEVHIRRLYYQKTYKLFCTEMGVSGWPQQWNGCYMSAFTRKSHPFICSTKLDISETKCRAYHTARYSFLLMSDEPVYVAEDRRSSTRTSMWLLQFMFLQSIYFRTIALPNAK